MTQPTRKKVYLRQSFRRRPHPTLVHLFVRRWMVQDAAHQRQSTSVCPPSLSTGNPSLQQAHKPPSKILSPFLGLGAATLLSFLAPFGLLASTLLMTMTQGTQQGLDLRATYGNFALEWVCGTLPLSPLRNACLLSLLQLICAPLVFRLPRTLGRLVSPYDGVSAFILPVPAWPSDDVSDDGSGSLSPRQTQGPLTLTPENIKARINGNRLVSPSSLERPGDESQMDEVMPLLNSKFFLSSLSFFPFLFLPYLSSSDAHRDRSLLQRGRRLPVLRPSSTNALPSQTYRLFFLYGPNQPRHVP